MPDIDLTGDKSPNTFPVIEPNTILHIYVIDTDIHLNGTFHFSTWTGRLIWKNVILVLLILLNIYHFL